MKNKGYIPNRSEVDLIDKIGKGGEFPVPEGYFETFNERIQKRITVAVIKSPQRLMRAQQIYLWGGIVSAAAVLVGVFLLYVPAIRIPQSFNKTIVATQDYLSDSYLNFYVYTTAERNLIQLSNSDSVYPKSNSIQTEGSDFSETLDPDAVMDYLFFNNSNEYSIIEGQ